MGFPFSLPGFEDIVVASNRGDIVYGVGGILVTIYVIVSMYIYIIGYLNTYFI